jgi:hypothetical protein
MEWTKGKIGDAFGYVTLHYKAADRLVWDQS